MTDQGGDLNAVRYRDWKIHFAVLEATSLPASAISPIGRRSLPSRPARYEMMWKHGEMGYFRWYADNLWFFVPAQGVIQRFFADYDKYSHQEGSSLSAAGINDNSMKMMEVMKKLQSLSPPN